MTCTTCDGRLIEWRDNGKPGRPCRACLSVPVTPEQRAFAADWFGFDVWSVNPWQRPEWFVWVGRSERGAVVPAWTGCGRALLTAWLSSKAGRDLSGRPPGGLFDALWPDALDGGTFDWDAFAIPDDAPDDLGTGRALVLCVKALEER